MERTGNFSSSKVADLMSKGRGNWSHKNVGAPFNTYVQHKVWENKLKQPLEKEHNALPTMWGKLVEVLAFKEMNDLSVSLTSKTRYGHPTIEHWNGMPDYVSERTKTVGDVKSPWTLNAFCGLVDACEEGLEAFKEYSSTYYWQLISNAILTESKYMELVVFMPYEDQIEEIRDMMEGDPDYYGMWNKPPSHLPSLKREGLYKNLNRFTWEVPEEDKELLTERVKLAVEELKKHLHEPKE